MCWVFEMTWLECRGKWGCHTAFSRDKRGSLEPLLVVELLWCRRIWRPNSTDLISIWSWSNQSVRWIQSGVSTVIPLQRKKHDLEMIRGTNVEHTLQHTHHPMKQKCVEHQRERQPSRVSGTTCEYLRRFCHLLFKLWLCCGIFLHKWLIGLCSFFGFHSSLQDINRQMNDYHHCALYTHTHTIDHCFPRSTEESAKEKVLFNLSRQKSLGLLLRV